MGLFVLLRCLVLKMKGGAEADGSLCSPEVPGLENEREVDGCLCAPGFKNEGFAGAPEVPGLRLTGSVGS